MSSVFAETASDAITALDSGDASQIVIGTNFIFKDGDGYSLRTIDVGVDETQSFTRTEIISQVQTLSKTTAITYTKSDADLDTVTYAQLSSTSATTTTSTPIVDANVLPGVVFYDGSADSTASSSSVRKNSKGQSVEQVGEYIIQYTNQGRIEAVCLASSGCNEATDWTVDHTLVGELRNGVTSISTDGYTVEDGDTTTIYTSEQTSNGISTTYVKQIKDGNTVRTIKGKVFGSGSQSYSIEDASANTVSSANEGLDTDKYFTNEYDEDTGLADFVVIDPDGKKTSVKLTEDQYIAVNHLGTLALGEGVSVADVFDSNNVVKSSIPLDTAAGITNSQDLARYTDDANLVTDDTIVSGSVIYTTDSSSGNIIKIEETNYLDDNDEQIKRTVTSEVGSNDYTYTVTKSVEGTTTNLFSGKSVEGGFEYTYDSDVVVGEGDDEVTIAAGTKIKVDSKGNIIELNGEAVTSGGLFGTEKCGEEDCSEEKQDLMETAGDYITQTESTLEDRRAQQVFANSGTAGQVTEIVRSGLETAQAFASLTPVLVSIGLFDAEMVQEWRNSVDSVFESVGLTSSYWVKQFCADDLELPEGKNTAFIEMPDGSISIGASIQGECTRLTGLDLSRYANSSDFKSNYYIVTGLITNPPVGDDDASYPLTFQIYLEGEEKVALFADNSSVNSIPSGQSFSLTNSNAFRIYSNKIFNQVCIEMDNPPEYFGGETRFCNVISCNELDDSADYSSEFPPIIETPDGVATTDVESGTGGTGYNYEGFDD